MKNHEQITVNNLREIVTEKNIDISNLERSIKSIKDNMAALPSTLKTNLLDALVGKMQDIEGEFVNEVGIIKNKLKIVDKISDQLSKYGDKNAEIIKHNIDDTLLQITD